MKTQEVLKKYDSKWKLLFKEERDRIKDFLDERSTRIEHIGSTAVEGMEARPIIDIMLGPENKKDIEIIRKKLKLLDYDEMILTYEMKGRYLLFKEDREKNIIGYTVLLTTVNSSLWRSKIRKREILKGSPEERAGYIAVKRRVLEKNAPDSERYLKMKEEHFSER